MEGFLEDATAQDRHCLNEEFYIREPSYQGHKLDLTEAMAEIIRVGADDFRWKCLCTGAFVT